VDADTPEQAEEIAMDVPTDSIREEVQEMTYDALQTPVKGLINTYVNCSTDKDPRGYYYLIT
jgi:hypothetical protein